VDCTGKRRGWGNAKSSRADSQGDRPKPIRGYTPPYVFPESCQIIAVMLWIRGIPSHNDESRLDPRRHDQEGEHDGEVPPEGMLHMYSEGKGRWVK